MKMIKVPSAMKLPEFLAWAEAQPEGRRYELADGEVVALARDTIRHNLTKLASSLALRDAVRVAGLACEVFIDGVGIVINDKTLRIPDASLQCATDQDLDSTVLKSPLIAIEVISPSIERDDTQSKLIDYFSVATISHYLIIFSEKRVAVHHQRNEQGTLDTRIVREGDIVLDPPGITVPGAALFGP
jgi:Uma2 family endonuclease